MPSVTTLCMDLAVAGLAQGDEVVPCMGTTLREWDLVVYLFGVHQPTFLQAQLAQRMLAHIAVANALPGTAIPATGVGVAVVLFIALGFLLGVFLTEPALSQLGASGM